LGSSLSDGTARTPPVNHKYCRRIKDPVQSTQQRRIFTEEFTPFIRTFVACQDQRIGKLLVIATVYDVKKHPGVLFVKDTASYFVYDQA